MRCDEGATDLHIGGSLKKLQLGNVDTHALVQLGDLLEVTAAAKASPLSASIGDVLGGDVQLDFATRAGVIKLHSWSYAGQLQAHLGAGGLTVATGDLIASVEVSSGNLGPVLIAQGGLLGAKLDVAGTLASFSAKGQVAGQIIAGAIGPVTVSGISNSVLGANTGSIGNVVAKGPILDSVLVAPLDSLGNITVQLTAEGGSLHAIEGIDFAALSLGKITASVAGAEEAYAIIRSSFQATSGNIGAIGATVSGKSVTDGVAIGESSLTADLGSIGNVSVKVISADAAAFLVALRDSSLQAGGNLGNITAIAQDTNKRPTGGSVNAVEDVVTSSDITAGGSIVGFTAKASGSAFTAGLGIFEGHRFVLSAGTSLGAVTVTTNIAAGQDGFGLSRTSFLAGTNMGAVKIGGDVPGTQVFDTSIVTGGRIASVSVTSKDGASGSVYESSIIAGWDHVLLEKANLTAGGIGTVTLSGSLTDSTIGAAGSIGTIVIGHDATGSTIAAGDQAGLDQQLLSTDDTFYRAGSIASLRVGGLFGTTSVVAGINPGGDGSFGGLDDTLGAVVAGLANGRLGSIFLSAPGVATGVSVPFLSNPTLPHLYALEAATLTSITVGKVKPLTAFTSPSELSFDGFADPSHDLIRQVG